MKLPLERKAAVMILFIVILVFVLKGVEFIQTRQSVDVSLAQQIIKEAFTASPTKISDCQCLPGFFPYKTKTGTIVCFSSLGNKSTKSCF
jgi:hypothetical protein